MVRLSHNWKIQRTKRTRETLKLTSLFQPTITSSSTHFFPTCPLPALSQHTHTEQNLNLFSPYPTHTHTHTSPNPAYPPLPCTQSLQAALGLCSHASVSRHWGWGLASRGCSWVLASNSSAPCSALWKAEKLKAPFIITCVGSITTATLRLANATAVNTNEALGRPVLA